MLCSLHCIRSLSSRRLLQWYLWPCRLSCKHPSPSSAWSSGHMAVPTVTCGPWTSCSCSPCCLAPTHMLLSSPSTWAVAPTSLPTGVTHCKVGQAYCECEHLHYFQSNTWHFAATKESHTCQVTQLFPWCIHKTKSSVYLNQTADVFKCGVRDGGVNTTHTYVVFT